MRQRVNVLQTHRPIGLLAGVTLLVAGACSSTNTAVPCESDAECAPHDMVCAIDLGVCQLIGDRGDGGESTGTGAQGNDDPSSSGAGGTDGGGNGDGTVDPGGSGGEPGPSGGTGGSGASSGSGGATSSGGQNGTGGTGGDIQPDDDIDDEDEPPVPEGPCADLCASPLPVVPQDPSEQTNLGTAATCHEASSNYNYIHCGWFAAPRTLRVNGTEIPCDDETAHALPALRNGGYCVQTTAGDHPEAFFILFDFIL